MKRLLYIIPFLFLGCAPKVVYVPTETIRTVTQIVHDTTIQVKLDVIRDSVEVRDTFSLLTNKYAYSTAEWHSGVLNHSLGIKDVSIPVKVQYIDISTHDTTTIVQPIDKKDKAKIDGYDKLKDSNKKKTATIWKLIGLLSLSVLWIFRKPIIKLVKLI